MRWTIKPKPDATLIKALQEQLSVNTIIATLLAQRNITTFKDAKTFFRPNLQDLHSPFQMKDMEKAVTRIEVAIANHENILVYGDYDVDGTTSVALMSSYLKTKTNLVATYIPDRYTEGYGISFQGIDFAHDNDFSLIIALDCGIKAIDKVAYANQKAIDVIICDHHRPSEVLPKAYAILNPKQVDCNYLYKELCGCGVGFKLIQALHEHEGNLIETLTPYLDLVVTATASDIVPITGENRTLAYFGLQTINSKPRVGLQVLLTSEKKKPLTITDIVFGIAPKINAAGRMQHADYAVKLLTETTSENAKNAAKIINTFNTERREIDQLTTEEALQQIKNDQEENHFTTVVYNAKWHKGVLGIVASRLIETHYKPTIVFTKSEDMLTASARSVKGFDIYEALEQCDTYIEQFGGHKYAAGLTIKPENYTAFKLAFEQVVKATIEKPSLTPEIRIDTELQLHDIDDKLIRIINQFAPFGPGNMQPVFITRQIVDTGFAKTVGEHQKHLKLTVTQPHSSALKFAAIGFNLGDKLSLVKDKKWVDIVYSISENHWNGKTTIQLKLKDIRASNGL